MKPILIISATRHKKSHTKIYQSLNMLSSDNKNAELKLEIIENNTHGLPTVYNKYINRKTLNKHDIVLFVHDDVYIDDLKLKGKLYNNLREMYDIVGVAGCIKPIIKAPVLWHLMSHPDDQRGVVFHEKQIAEDQIATYASSFGHTPSRVAIIDGMFMAINLKRVLSTQWRFDEQFDFNHYDIAGCLTANKEKLKIGVAPIHTIHSSKGLTSIDDVSWVESQQKFLDTYTDVHNNRS